MTGKLRNAVLTVGAWMLGASAFAQAPAAPASALLGTDCDAPPI